MYNISKQVIGYEISQILDVYLNIQNKKMLCEVLKKLFFTQ